MKLEFSKANRFLPFLILLGIALGYAEVVMGSKYNTLQVILIHLLTSFLIGYSILILLINDKILFSKLKHVWQKYIVLLVLFIAVAIIASEIEVICRNVIFDNSPYKFLSGGKIYLLNSLITIIIGFGSYISIQFPWPGQVKEEEEIENEGVNQELEAIQQIPLKEGDNIILLDVNEVAFFEAYDNYAMVFDIEGKKRLCDFSLRFLESRLSKDFIRIHRKHIINRNHIAKIQPHLNGRYVIEMKNKIKVISSKSSAPLIKAIIKLN
jgi:hypothetical protein